jgi:hypothetical protein
VWICWGSLSENGGAAENYENLLGGESGVQVFELREIVSCADFNKDNVPAPRSQDLSVKREMPSPDSSQA